MNVADTAGSSPALPSPFSPSRSKPGEQAVKSSSRKQSKGDRSVAPSPARLGHEKPEGKQEIQHPHEEGAFATFPRMAENLSRVRALQKTKERVLQERTFWLDKWGQSFEKEYAEGKFSPLRAFRWEEFEKARQAFNKNGIDYKTKIAPLFHPRVRNVLLRFVAKSAFEDTKKEWRKRVKRYEGPVRVLTENDAPFPEEEKQRIEAAYEQIQKLNLDEVILDQAAPILGLSREEIIRTNLKTSPQKDQAWREMRNVLFEALMKEQTNRKPMTRWKAADLIAKLFQSLTPTWYQATYSADSVRQTAGARQKSCST